VNTLHEIAGTVVLSTPAEGTPVRGDGDVMDLIGDALGNHAEVVVLPVDRLDESFFSLRTGVAGAIVQKFVNYRVKLAVIGDISGFVDRSTAMRDFVTEANRGRQVWFLPEMEALNARLSGS